MRISLWSRIGLLFAGGLFVAAAVLYQNSLQVRHKHVGMPVSMPLSLAPGEIESPEFDAEKGMNYDIEITPRGNFTNSRQTDVSWTISEQGHAVAKGDSTRDYARDGNDLVVGFFRPEHDGRYKLHMTFHNLVAAAGDSPPKLIVVLDMGNRDDIAMGAGILEFAAAICGVVGLVALAFAVTGIFTKRKNVQQQAGAANRG